MILIAVANSSPVYTLKMENKDFIMAILRFCLFLCSSSVSQSYFYTRILYILEVVLIIT